MNTTIDLKRIGIFILFSFVIAWGAAFILSQNGGLTNSPQIGNVPGLSLALILLTTLYMPAPTIAHILTRLITREGWKNLYLRPYFRSGWRYWLLCWVCPGLMTILGAALFFLLFPGTFDPDLTTLRQLMKNAPAMAALPPSELWNYIIIQTIAAIIIAPMVNAIPIFGEEFGWRAYLQTKLMPLGARKAMMIMGAIWGIWHAPIIAMGHNYGTNYPGAPWSGILMMVWFTFVFGTFIGWASWRARSVWAAVIGHGALTGIAGISVLFTRNSFNHF
jgi:membrane protease YdiL (CAAX protease family)